MSAQASRSANAYSDACATIADLIQVFVYLVIVLFVSPLAALLAVFGGALMVVLYRPFIKMTRAAGADQTRSMRTVVARLTELLAEVKPVKAVGREDDVWPLLERETQEFQTAQRRVILARESVSAFHEPIAVSGGRPNAAEVGNHLMNFALPRGLQHRLAGLFSKAG